MKMHPPRSQNAMSTTFIHVELKRVVLVKNHESNKNITKYA
jgi:hypothetical protein